MKKTFLLLVILWPGWLFAQQISLDSCLQWAVQAQAYEQDAALLAQSRSLAMQNSGKSNLPQITLDGTATWQNENITIQVPPVPGFDAPTVPTNFNRLLINFNQVIYNGRLAAHKKQLDSLTYGNRLYQLEADKAKLKAQVTGLYAAVLLARAQQDILQRQLATIQARARQLQGAVEAGTAYRSHYTALQAEEIKLQQAITEVTYQEEALRQQLARLTDHAIPARAELTLPEIDIEQAGVEARPELRLLLNQQSTLQAQQSLSKAARHPYVGVFANAGLGYPGYDIFNPEIRPMLLVGLKIKWQLYDWQKSRNERQLLAWNSRLVGYQYERAKRQLELELLKQAREIEKYEKLVQQDDELVNLRERVVEEVGARLQGGTATSTEYLTEVNNRAMAELNREVHHIKWLLAKLNYAIIQGK